MVLSFLTEFLGFVTLAGVIILSRFATKFWQIVIGVILVILGLFGLGK